MDSRTSLSTLRERAKLALMLAHPEEIIEILRKHGVDAQSDPQGSHPTDIVIKVPQYDLSLRFRTDNFPLALESYVFDNRAITAALEELAQYAEAWQRELERSPDYQRWAGLLTLGN